jgi:hypothetical protein
VTPGDNLPPNAFLSPENLDAWARDTNGAPLPQDQKDELDLLDQDDGKLRHLTSLFRARRLLTSSTVSKGLSSSTSCKLKQMKKRPGETWFAYFPLAIVRYLFLLGKTWIQSSTGTQLKLPHFNTFPILLLPVQLCHSLSQFLLRNTLNLELPFRPGFVEQTVNQRGVTAFDAK